jgi:hypothetical protein
MPHPPLRFSNLYSPISDPQSSISNLRSPICPPSSIFILPLVASLVGSSYIQRIESDYSVATLHLNRDLSLCLSSSAANVNTRFRR